MNAATWILLFLLTGGLAYVMATRMCARAEKHKNRHGSTSLSEMSKPPLRVYKYRAVELQICDDPCESALAIAGKRLLKSEAPALPLAGCPHKKCMCAYTQYNDRRLTQRRSDSYPYGMPMGSAGRGREERRKIIHDRRKGCSG
ncbi:MAG: hypothetical protein FWD51_04135 [Betaproteobacteria bacterium]|nr:hypothetical protein [Betaproteobacteria bacterium]